MNRLAASVVAIAIVATPVFAQQAAPKPVFEVARVNPGKGVKTRQMRVEHLGRATVVQVGPAVLTRVHLREVATGTEKLAVTSGAKPEKRDVPVLRLRFTKDGARAMSELSRAAQGQLLAVIIDGQIVAMPQVEQPITGSAWTVSGNFTTETAKALAAKVNASK
ncbi:MAG: hypothetical protein ABMA13_13155 [Chthoniobacteraceae bacterium]